MPFLSSLTAMVKRECGSCTPSAQGVVFRLSYRYLTEPMERLVPMVNGWLTLFMLKADPNTGSIIKEGMRRTFGYSIFTLINPRRSRTGQARIPRRCGMGRRFITSRTRELNND